MGGEEVAGTIFIEDLSVLKGPVSIIDPEGWTGQLYRPALQRRPRQVEARFIPYFAWDNRGKSEMPVWIPER